MKRRAVLATAALALVRGTGAAGQYSVMPPVGVDFGASTRQVALSGYLAVRADGREDTVSFSLARARLAAQARPHRYVGIRLQADFAAGGKVEPDSSVGPFSLTDAFIQLEPPPDTTRRPIVRPRLLVGQMRVPFGLERLTPFSALLTADRAEASDRIAYGRDVGVTAEVEIAAHARLSAGAFNGEGSNVFVNEDGELLGAVRLGVSPARWMGIGGKFAVEGRDRRWGADVRLIPGRVTLEGEWLERDDASDGFRARGGYLLGAWRVLAWLQPVVKVERYREPGGGVRQDDTILGINALPWNGVLRVQCDAVFPTDDSEDPRRRFLAQAILRF